MNIVFFVLSNGSSPMMRHQLDDRTDAPDEAAHEIDAMDT